MYRVSRYSIWSISSISACIIIIIFNIITIVIFTFAYTSSYTTPAIVVTKIQGVWWRRVDDASSPRAKNVVFAVPCTVRHAHVLRASGTRRSGRYDIIIIIRRNLSDLFFSFRRRRRVHTSLAPTHRRPECDGNEFCRHEWMSFDTESRTCVRRASATRPCDVTVWRATPPPPHARTERANMIESYTFCSGRFSRRERKITAERPPRRDAVGRWTWTTVRREIKQRDSDPPPPPDSSRDRF